MSNIYSEVLIQAASAVGGEDKLAASLNVEKGELTAWILGSTPPVEAVLRSLRLIENGNRAAAGMFRGPAIPSGIAARTGATR
jgi:hypothetical protein